MKKLLILILIFTFIVGQANAITISGATVSSIKIKQLPRILIMGDSITEGVGNTPWGYRQLLQQALLPSHRFDYVGSFTDPDSDATYDVDHSGVSGDKISDLSSRVSSELSTYFIDGHIDGDAVVIAIGTNDMFGEASSYPYELEMTELKDNLVSVILAFDPEMIIYIVSPPPSTNTGIDAETDDWALAESEAVTTWSLPNVFYVPVHEALVAGCSPISSCLADDLHPNATGAAITASTLANFIKQHQ